MKKLLLLIAALLAIPSIQGMAFARNLLTRTALDKTTKVAFWGVLAGATTFAQYQENAQNSPDNLFPVSPEFNSWAHKRMKRVGIQNPESVTIAKYLTTLNGKPIEVSKAMRNDPFCEKARSLHASANSSKNLIHLEGVTPQLYEFIAQEERLQSATTDQEKAVILQERSQKYTDEQIQKLYNASHTLASFLDHESAHILHNDSMLGSVAVQTLQAVSLFKGTKALIKPSTLPVSVLRSLVRIPNSIGLLTLSGILMNPIIRAKEQRADNHIEDKPEILRAAINLWTIKQEKRIAKFKKKTLAAHEQIPAYIHPLLRPQCDDYGFFKYEDAPRYMREIVDWHFDPQHPSHTTRIEKLQARLDALEKQTQ